MLRTILCCCVFALAAGLGRAQGAPDVNKFTTEFNKLIEFKDEKGLDKLLKSHNDMPAAALTYFQTMRFEILGGKKASEEKLEVLKAAFKRVFEGSEVLDKLERWCDSQDSSSFRGYDMAQRNVSQAWRFYTDANSRTDTPRKTFEDACKALRESAQQMQQSGQMVDAAEAWKLVAICLFRYPDKTVQDIRDTIWALERYVEFRQAWGWTQDAYYTLNLNTLKGQKQALEAKTADAQKRESEGYKADAKGIDALAMPNSTPSPLRLEFALLPEWDSELDYCQRGGPVPPAWWAGSFGKDQKEARFTGFRRGELSMIRLGANKFGVTTQPSDDKRTQEVEVGNKGKPTQFFLDPEHKVPYGLFFWVGSDREHIGEAEVNLAPADANTSVYYRSAASWATTAGGETITLYDDNCSGYPMDADPLAVPLKMATLGFPKDDPRAVTPLMDSMRIGKGPRVPFSEFAHVGAEWLWLHRDPDKGETVVARPLNPEYLKLGKVKLNWSGPKPTAPSQLVIRGTGDFQTACYDVASGKEIEVPSGDYTVIFGRITQGKVPRLQMASIYQGESKPFTVEPGKTFELKMGAPFTLDFDRKGTASDVEIDATHIALFESSGCVIAELQGMSPAPEVLASKTADGKAAKTIGKFLKFTDAESLNQAAVKYPDIGMMIACMPMPEGAKAGDMVLKLKLPTAGMAVGLQMKKHALFGKLDPRKWRTNAE